MQLASKGNRLLLIARREERLQHLWNHLPSPENHTIYPCDVGDAGAVRRVCEQILDEGHRLDVLILNAGTSFGFDVNRIDIDNFHREFAVNYFQTVYFLKYLLPGMIERGSGMVAVNASMAGYRGMPDAAPYSSSKAALANLVEALRVDLWKRGIDFVLISPGFVKSEMTDRNKFKMPFLMETERAVRIIIRGMEKNKAEICFPWQMVLLLKMARILPFKIYARLMQGKR